MVYWLYRPVTPEDEGSSPFDPAKYAKGLEII